MAINSELGASAAIFMAGYSIDCLMLRYQVSPHCESLKIDAGPDLQYKANIVVTSVKPDPAAKFLRVSSLETCNDL